MKHIKTFESFLNEAHLPFNIEKEIKLNGVQFELDEERTEEDDDKRLDPVAVYTADDSRSGAFWAIKAGKMGNDSYLEISKDDTVLFSNKYSSSQRAYFEQDCMNSLGFLPEL